MATSKNNTPAKRSSAKRKYSDEDLAIIKRELSKEIKSNFRKYEGASKSRHNSDWFTSNQSVNQEVQQALSYLRERSRDLARNNPYVRKALRSFPNNVVGTGIIPKAIIKAKGDEKWLKEAWQAWAMSLDCDYDQQWNFYGIERLIFRTMLESGECLVRKVRATSDYTIPLRLQVLEADYIDTSKHSSGSWFTDKGIEYIDYYGIRFNKKGERTGYWIYKQHPSEFAAESSLVPAADIIHFYEAERTGQVRGIPVTHAVLLRTRDLDDYEFTERIRNKVAACFSVFITDTSTAEGDGDVPENEKVEPGTIQYLEPGKSVTVATPPSTNGYGAFVRNNLQGIAAGLGVTYEILTGDYSNVNFSSGRMGWIEFAREVEHLQYNVLVPRLQKLYQWFVDAAKMAGFISTSTTVFTTWTAPRREMIDPYKEIMAIREQLRAGLISWQEVVKQLGYIPEELIEELKADKTMWDEIGLLPTSDPRFDPNRVEGPDEEMMKDEEPAKAKE